MRSIDELTQAFASDSIKFESAEGELTCCHVNNRFAEAKIFLHGAHVTHFQPSGQRPLLWMSSESRFDAQSPIRGGIPLCWPWFGPHPNQTEYPQHGFARTSLWDVRAILETADSTELILGLTHDDSSAQLVDWEFDARYRVSVGKSLTVELGITNTGKANMQDVGAALHSYFLVSSIESVFVDGLEGKQYFDKLLDAQQTQTAKLHITGETDRVYFGTQDPIIITDDSRSISITGQGSNSTVVWNPWIAKSQRMEDFPNDGYHEMLCVETANALSDVRCIEPGDTHILSQTAAIFDVVTKI